MHVLDPRVGHFELELGLGTAGHAAKVVVKRFEHLPGPVLGRSQAGEKKHKKESHTES